MVLLAFYRVQCSCRSICLGKGLAWPSPIRLLTSLWPFLFDFSTGSSVVFTLSATGVFARAPS